MNCANMRSVTSQGSAYGRFRRALDTRNATIALAAAAELDLRRCPVPIYREEDNGDSPLDTTRTKEDTRPCSCSSLRRRVRGDVRCQPPKPT